MSTMIKADKVNVLSGNTVVLDGVPFLLFGTHAPTVESKEGKASRAALTEKLKSGEVTATIIKDRRKTSQQDMCELFVDGENVNHWLVKNSYAKAYVGGE